MFISKEKERVEPNRDNKEKARPILIYCEIVAQPIISLSLPQFASRCGIRESPVSFFIYER